MEVVNEKYVLEHMIRNPERLEDWTLFENPRVRAVAEYCHRFHKRFGAPPGTSEIGSAVLSEEIKYKDMSVSFVETLRDVDPSMNPEFLTNQHSLWRDERNVTLATMQIVEVAKTQTKDKAEKILQLAEQLVSSRNAVSQRKSLFTAKPASEWVREAKEQERPRMIFSELWFEGEVCALFASPNMGKSALSVQIADAVSRGSRIKGFENELDSQRVLYLDFELNTKQFGNRSISDEGEEYPFHPNFLRVKINGNDWKKLGFKSYEHFFEKSLEDLIVSSGARVMIFDNISAILREGEKSINAQNTMDLLLSLRDRYGMSILVIGHTTKRDGTMPIQAYDMAGSSVLMNKFDAMFAIGQVRGDQPTKYIKQLKVRSSEFAFDGENVAVCRLSKPGSLLQFEYMDRAAEYALLSDEKRQQLDSRNAEIARLHEQGMSYREIAKKTGLHFTMVQKIVKQSAAPKERPRKMDDLLSIPKLDGFENM